MTSYSRNKKKSLSFFRRFSTKKFIVLGTVLLVLGGLSLTVLLAQYQSSPLQQHAASSQSVYPANIQLDGGQFDYPYGHYDQKALENPNIKAVVVRLDWSDVETAQGVFNWGPFNTEVDNWRAVGKKFAIVVRYANEPAAGKGVTCTGTTHANQYLPDWEIARIPTRCTASGVVIPDYFNPTFQTDLLSFVNAISAHIQAQGYQGSILYGRFAYGQGGEDYYCIGCNADDLKVVDGWGYTIPAWRDWQEQLFLKYQQAFSLAPVIYAMGGNIVDPANGQQVYQEVATFALQHGGGIGQEGLNPKDKYINGNIVSFMKQARQQYPNAYMELAPVQQLKDSTSAGCDIHCVAQTDITTANAAQAWTVEWYPIDAGENAPLLNDVFQAWQAMVDLRTPSAAPTATFTPTPTILPTSIPTPRITCTPMPPQCKAGSRLGIMCPVMPRSGWCPETTPTTIPGCHYVPLPQCPAPPNQLPPHYCERLICPGITPTCTPRPACLNQNPPCRIPEPVGGWCSHVVR